MSDAQIQQITSMELQVFGPVTDASLLPCPFAGHDCSGDEPKSSYPTLGFQFTSGGNPLKHACYVVCRKCSFVRGPTCYADTYKEARLLAIAAWNSRPGESVATVRTQPPWRASEGE